MWFLILIEAIIITAFITWGVVKKASFWTILKDTGLVAGGLGFLVVIALLASSPRPETMPLISERDIPVTTEDLSQLGNIEPNNESSLIIPFVTKDSSLDRLINHVDILQSARQHSFIHETIRGQPASFFHLPRRFVNNTLYLYGTFN
jgi:hypothetical protein